MSTTSYKEKYLSNDFDVMLPAVAKNTAIKKLIEDSGLSFREIEERSGGTISFNQVQAYASGTSTNPQKKSIVALAKAIGASPVKVFLAFLGEEADDPAKYPEFLQTLLSEYQRLQPKDREELAETLKMLADNVHGRLRKSSR